MRPTSLRERPASPSGAAQARYPLIDLRVQMSNRPDLALRRADIADADLIGQLLHDFNREFDEATPGARKLSERVRQLLSRGEITVLLGGQGPDGLAVLGFRQAIWTEALECYLAELYVVPERRRRGVGRALMLSA